MIKSILLCGVPVCVNVIHNVMVTIMHKIKLCVNQITFV